MNGLSSQHLRVYQAIAAHLASRRIPPTYRQIADAAGYKSVSDAHRVVKILRRLGYVQLEDGCPRTIQLTEKVPGEAA